MNKPGIPKVDCQCEPCVFARGLSDEAVGQYMQAITSEALRRAGLDPEVVAKQIDEINDPTLAMNSRALGRIFEAEGNKDQ